MITIQAGQARALVDALDSVGVPDDHLVNLRVPVRMDNLRRDDDVVAELNADESLILECDARSWRLTS